MAALRASIALTRACPDIKVCLDEADMPESGVLFESRTTSQIFSPERGRRGKAMSYSQKVRFVR